MRSTTLDADLNISVMKDLFRMRAARRNFSFLKDSPVWELPFAQSPRRSNGNKEAGRTPLAGHPAGLSSSWPFPWGKCPSGESADGL